MRTFTASGFGRLALAALACASPGCAGVNSPQPRAAPPRPAVDLSAIKESLEGLRRGMRDQERRIEGAREEVQRLADAFARAREEREGERKEARDALEKAGKAATGLEARIGNLESRVSLLGARVSRAAARKRELVAGPAGAPSRVAPVGAPLADARIAAVGRPGNRDVPAAGLPDGGARTPAASRETLAALPAPAPPPGSEPAEEDYARAVRALREEDYARARALLEAFIERRPTHELADDAQYWIGQSYFQEKNFERAILAFNKVQVDYANADKAPEALLLEALSFLNLGDQASARDLLGRVIGKYPDSGAASAARERLESL